MINVIAVITAHPGKRQDILDVLLPALPANMIENGCLEYTVTVDADVVGSMHSQTKFGPDTFTIVEKWQSLEHLKAHSVDEIVTEYLETISPFLKSRVVYFLSGVGGFHINY